MQKQKQQLCRKIHSLLQKGSKQEVLMGASSETLMGYLIKDNHNPHEIMNAIVSLVIEGVVEFDSYLETYRVKHVFNGIVHGR